jgi:hypothetical protein
VAGAVREPRVRTFFYGSYMNPAVLAEVTHAELTRLYAHAQDVLGETYLPHPVLVQASGAAPGRWWPALCYLAPSMTPARADPAYVERILAPARELGFPEWYLARLRAAGAS